MDKIREALGNLINGWDNYRNEYEMLGGDDIRTGRAWSKMTHLRHEADSAERRTAMGPDRIWVMEFGEGYKAQALTYPISQEIAVNTEYVRSTPAREHADELRELLLLFTVPQENPNEWCKLFNRACDLLEKIACEEEQDA